MSRYLDPKSDLVFKKIFGKHPALLKSLLNAVLPLPSDGLIESLEYLPADNVPEIPQFKYSVVDARCKDSLGRHFIVEMQIRWSEHFASRMLFNAASVYVRQLNRGEIYDKLSPVYGLAFVDSSFTDEADWFHHYRLTHTKDSSKTIDDIQLIMLELPKFQPKTWAEKKLTVLWLRFMTEIDEKTHTVDQALLEVPEIKEALLLAEESAYTPEELEAYDRNWDAIRTENTYVTDKMNEGLKKGLEKGLKKGLKKGREEGREEGRSEREHEITKNLLLKSIDVDTVVSSTGLSIEVVTAIKDELGL